MLGAAGGTYPPYLLPKEDWKDGLAYSEPGAARAFFYNDLTDEQAAPFVALLKPQSIVSCEDPIGFAADELTIPVYYLLCEDDRALPAFIQQRACDGIPALKRKLTWASGHFPFLTEPGRFVEEIVDIIKSETA